MVTKDITISQRVFEENNKIFIKSKYVCITKLQKKSNTFLLIIQYDLFLYFRENL